MEIEFLLKKILMERGLYGHGIVNELAGYLHIHRHSVRALLHDEAKTISMRVLGDLCRWLREHGAPAEELPQALFGARAPGLWKAVAGTARVTMYLGEYQQVLGEGDGESRVWNWVSRADSAAANSISEQLYELRSQGNKQQLLRTSYVPFRFETSPRAERQKYLREDAKQAEKTFGEMRRHAADTTSILIGSMEVNYLVEVMVANLFSCKPFVPADGRPRVPFHMVFRHPAIDMESCFGSLRPPPRFTGHAAPGIYYLDKKSRWVPCPWVLGKQDAGLTIVVHESAANSLKVIMFGFSAVATSAMASHVIPHPRPFWPPYFERRGRRIGVYVCKLAFGEKPSTTHKGPVQVAKFEVVPLDAALLDKHMRSRAKT